MANAIKLRGAKLQTEMDERFEKLREHGNRLVTKNNSTLEHFVVYVRVAKQVIQHFSNKLDTLIKDMALLKQNQDGVSEMSYRVQGADRHSDKGMVVIFQSMVDYLISPQEQAYFFNECVGDVMGNLECLAMVENMAKVMAADIVFI